MSCSTRSSFTCIAGEDGAAVGLQKPSVAIAGGAREGAGDVAEEFALEQRLAQAPAGHLDEPPAPAALPMDFPGQQRLAGAALAGHEHGGWGRGHPRDHVEDAGDRRMGAEHAAGRRRADGNAVAGDGHGSVDRGEDFAVGRGHGDRGIGPRRGRPRGPFDDGGDDTGRSRRHANRFRHDAGAGVRQAGVENACRPAAAARGPHALGHRTGRHGVVTETAEPLGEGRGRPPVVVDDEDAAGLRRRVVRKGGHEWLTGGGGRPADSPPIL